MSEEEKLEILKDKFLKYHLEYKDEEMLFGIIDKLQKELDNSISKDIIRDKIKELGSIKGDLATYIAVTEKMKILNELLGG